MCNKQDRTKASEHQTLGPTPCLFRVHLKKSHMEDQVNGSQFLKRLKKLSPSTLYTTHLKLTLFLQMQINVNRRLIIVL